MSAEFRSGAITLCAPRSCISSSRSLSVYDATLLLERAVNPTLSTEASPDPALLVSRRLHQSGINALNVLPVSKYRRTSQERCLCATTHRYRHLSASDSLQIVSGGDDNVICTCNLDLATSTLQGVLKLEHAHASTIQGADCSSRSGRGELS